ncbi:MAG: PKD domain-containing protein [Oligoflexia bacterium]|nr:PKD domain-containing protein [Oligoflexia bacterium]
MRSVRGKIKKGFKFLSLALFGFVLLQYQNCGSSNGTGGLNLGSSGNNPPPRGVSTSISGNTSITVNTASTFSAIVSGGTSPFYYSWITDGATGSCTNSPSCQLTYSSTGSKIINLTVSDSKGFSSSTTLTITVSQTTNPPTACTSSYGAIDLAFESTPLTYQNADCTITVRGWAWHKDAFQNTKVIITTNANTASAETTISGIRDDVHGIYSCIPTSPQGQPGYITTVPATFPNSNQIALYLDVKNPANSNVARIGFVTINSHTNCYVPPDNGCNPNGPLCQQQ